MDRAVAAQDSQCQQHWSPTQNKSESTVHQNRLKEISQPNVGLYTPNNSKSTPRRFNYELILVDTKEPLLILLSMIMALWYESNCHIFDIPRYLEVKWQKCLRFTLKYFSTHKKYSTILVIIQSREWVHVSLKEETEQALSWKQDSILGQTVNFEWYAQYLWKRHTNWKSRPFSWKSRKEEPQGFLLLKEYHNYLYNWIESYSSIMLIGVWPQVYW